MTESGIYSTWPAKFQSWFYLFILKVSNILKKKIIKKRVMKSVRWLRQKKKKKRWAFNTHVTNDSISFSSD